MEFLELTHRQGDVHFYKIEEFPKGDRVQDSQCKDLILAYGEASGHCHEVENKTAVEAFKIMNELFLNVTEETAVRHGRIKGYEGEESDKDYHDEITLPPGKYFIGIVPETDHINKVVRKVVD